MKLVQGRRLDQHRDELGGVPERLRTFQKICEAVAFAHAHQVLHRDLKPQNIMVGRFGEVLVMDWGLAKLLNAEMPAESDPAPTNSARSKSGSDAEPPRHGHRARRGSGHPRLHGAGAGARRDRSRRSARGCLLAGRGAEVLAGRFRSDAQGPGGDRGKATAENAEQRYGSVEELANDIAHYLDGLPVSAYPEGPLVRLWRWVVKNRAWILLIVAYLVMRALFILWRGR